MLYCNMNILHNEYPKQTFRWIPGKRAEIARKKCGIFKVLPSAGMGWPLSIYIDLFLHGSEEPYWYFKLFVQYPRFLIWSGIDRSGSNLSGRTNWLWIRILDFFLDRIQEKKRMNPDLSAHLFYDNFQLKIVFFFFF